ncbi:hypothetical protein J4T85_019525 [Sinorhizobium medicae]|uniref:hypothetical protein n=1 Tax=Sinorhizobium medicae TaxID=110321 RepID=UPI001AAEDFB7|nr:hypothetical protein [Sinorhizobium medicae]MBO1963870.1 hypothetical protein [Sinorhizobium medicae]
MSLTADFAQPSIPIYPKAARRPAPFSLRLSESEKSDLVARAGARPVSAYIKECLFGDHAPRRARQTGFAVADREALARVLALLGRSRLANNLNQLAYAVNIGSLPLTPETEEELLAAISEVREMRQLLLSALGMKCGAAQ